MSTNEPTRNNRHDRDPDVVETEGDTSTAAGVPSDNATLSSVFDELGEEGYTASFIVRADGHVQCSVCTTTLAVADLRPDRMRRLEGASDPDDELLVVAAPCPACGAKASFVLGFGPSASEDDSLVVAELDFDGLPDRASTGGS